MASKPLELVLIVTAHMILNVLGEDQITGILGSNITLHFTFNISITNNTFVGIYRANETKIDDNKLHKRQLDIYPNYVDYHITNLRLHHSDIYFATVFNSEYPLPKSNTVHLTVENRITTVPPILTTSTETQDESPSLSLIITVLVVPSVVLLATLLPILICCVMKTKDKLQEQPQQSSNPTLQETIDVPCSAAAPSVIYSNAAAPSVIYSVLDFPKRPPPVVEPHPSDTEYAAVSYLPEIRRI